MRRAFVVAILGVLFTSCGGGSGPGNPEVTITGGNWSFSSTSANPTAQFVFFGGSLQQSGKAISGVLTIGFPACLTPLATFNVAGEVSGSSFTLKSNAADGGVLTIKGTVSGPKSLLATFSVAGGCADGEQGSVMGTYVPPLTGTWKATEDVAGSQVTITLTLTQSSTVSPQGFFSISGTAQYEGSPCELSGTVDPLISLVSGSLVGIMVNTSEAGGNSGQVLYGGMLQDPQTATSFQGFENILMGSCTGSGQIVTFTKQ
jgi:hypothetical protein